MGGRTRDRYANRHNFLVFLSKLTDEASASTLYTAPNNLRSIGQVNGSAVLRCAPALRVTLPACCGSGQ